MANLSCTAGKIAISDIIQAVNDKASKDDYATSADGGTIKLKIDDSNPADVILYITTDGTVPGA